MMTTNEKHKRNMSPPTLDPHIITVTNENKKVKPKTVTPSKVSVNARGCTSFTTIPSRKLVSNGASHSAQKKGFLANRFDILANLHDSSMDCSERGLRFETGVQPCRDINVPLNTNHAQIPSRDTNNAEIQAHPTNTISGNKRSLLHKQQKSPPNSQVPQVRQNPLHQSVPMPKIEPSTSTFLNKTSKHVQRLQDDQSLVHPEKIPLFVWQNKSLSKDHAACISQNGGDFGYIPLQFLTIYKGPKISWGRVPDILEAHTIIRNSGAPNFLKARIPIATQLNPDKWYFHLRDYWDRQLPDLIKYGFPLDFDRGKPLQPTYDNHASAIQHIDCVEQYINEELQYGAIYGPFKDLPFPVHVSPLMTRPKQNSDKRRTIMDLSWPRGASVNNAIHKFRYLNTYFSLSYPSIDNIVNKVKALGPGSLLFKVDISRAFRHLRIDPGDIDLLGILHQDLLLDGSLPFGFRLGSGFFERCSDAIRFIMKQHNHNALLNYIDDLIYIGLPSTIHDSYQFLLSLLQDLGLEVSDSKLVPPSTCVTCLGIQVDTIQKTLSIPDEKLQEIKNTCKTWTHKNVVTKQQLQSLLGSLLYISKCIKPARIFLNRMLQLLRSHHDSKKFVLNSEFFRDLSWFNTFLNQYNGVTYFDHKKSDYTVHLDASLTGMGATFANMVYALPIPSDCKKLHITQLEMLNVVVALKVWASAWSNKIIDIKCDNLAVVEVLTSNKTKDAFLATCARNVWLICAIFNISIRVWHIPGKYNHIADLLSRWTVTPDPSYKLQQMLPNYVWIPTHVDFLKLNYDI